MAKKSKPCKCVAKVNKMLEKDNTVLDQVSMVNFTTGKIRQTIKIATARRDRMKPRTKVKIVLPAFCPFCGTKINKAA